jgi:hypothetical protein
MQGRSLSSTCVEPEIRGSGCDAETTTRRDDAMGVTYRHRIRYLTAALLGIGVSLGAEAPTAVHVEMPEQTEGLI